MTVGMGLYAMDAAVDEILAAEHKPLLLKLATRRQ